MPLIESIKTFLGFSQAKALIGSTIVQTHNTIFPSYDSWREIKAYKVIDDVYSVVNRLARQAASVPMYAYTMGRDNETEDAPYDSLAAEFLRREMTYAKRLELYTWLFLRGECFVFLDYVDGPDSRVKSMHFLNPSFITLVISDTFPEYIVKYRYQDFNKKQDFFIEPEEMVFLKYFNPTEGSQNAWRGFSPIIAMKDRLTRLKAGMDTSVAQMQNGGVPGVLRIKDLQHNAQSKGVVDAIKDNLGRFLRNSDNKGAPMVMPGDVDYIAMGTALADLTVAELADIDFKKICNAYQVSDVLFNSDSSSTESNVKEMRQMMWTNAIIPNLVLVEDGFNVVLFPKFGPTIAGRYDLGSIKDLQKNLKEVVETLSAAPVMIPNDVFEAMGYERRPEPEYDQPLIKQGYTTIEDIQPIDPLLDE